MATTEDRIRRQRVGLICVLVPLALAAVAALLAWNRTPQVGADEEVFLTVDALFTAVTARDERLLTQCEERLKSHRAAGRLPTEAARVLERIIANARSGSWESAAERLYDFMKNQKREAATGHPPPRKRPFEKGGR